MIKQPAFAAFVEQRLPYHARCQRENVIAPFPPQRRARKALHGTKVWLSYRLRDIRRGRSPLSPSWSQPGIPSRFAVGSLVRVRELPEIEATLDAHRRTRGLEFVRAQTLTCGKIFRVAVHLTHMIDDFGIERSVNRSVTLEGVTCGILPGQSACERECPLMYRDEWLEPVAAGSDPAPSLRPYIGYASVRNSDEIRERLDAGGGTDGLKFMPEMARYAGGRYPILRKVGRDVDLIGGVASVSAPIYVLADLVCTGEALWTLGCERRCTLLWHEAGLGDIVMNAESR